MDHRSVSRWVLVAVALGLGVAVAVGLSVGLSREQGVALAASVPVEAQTVSAQAGTAPNTPYLVKDINPVGAGSWPNEMVAMGAQVFLATGDGIHGHELWKSDGTEEGTVLVKDIFPGSEDSWPEELTDVNGTLFFAADDGVHGYELWKSDGTAGGTVMVKDINSLSTCESYGWNPGGGSYPCGSQPEDLIAVDGLLYFTADDGSGGRELWKSNGTPGGTVMVKDINPGGDSTCGYSSYYNKIGVGGVLYFGADDGSTGCELWRSEGAEANTVRVRDIYTGTDGSGPQWLTGMGGALFFAADDGVHGLELWKSDGTLTGTVLLKDIWPDFPGSSLWWLTEVSGTLFFGAADDVHDMELWTSDGTPTGTVMVSDIVTVPHPVGGGMGSYPSYLVDVDGELFFAASHYLWGDLGLWKSDGTMTGTVLVTDVNAAPILWFGLPAPHEIDTMHAMDGELYFTAKGESGGWELWKSDGTEGGTVVLKDIWAGSSSSYPWLMTEVSGTLFFAPERGDGVHGSELWKTDGTAGGTVMVKDIDPGTDGSYLYVGRIFYPYFVEMGDEVFFGADDGSNGAELWRSDGTEVGTVMVKDIHTGTYSASYDVRPNASDPAYMTELSGVLLFAATDAAHGEELWRSDGTGSGTVLVRDIFTGTDYHTQPNHSSPEFLTAVGGEVFFSASDEVHGRELWKSDGTEANTVLVKDIYTGTSGWNREPWWLTPVSGTLFFSADDGVHSRELWKSDGTLTGTVLISDVNTLSTCSGGEDPGSGTDPCGSFPEPLAVVSETLYFVADDGIHGYELWRSDGTPTGTMMVADIAAGSDSALDTDYYPYIAWIEGKPSPAQVMDGMLFFAADDGSSGQELWRSDGTEVGTTRVRDIYTGTESSAPEWLTVVSDTLYFGADDGVHGRELWKSDGTMTGTVMVEEIYPGVDIGGALNSSDPRVLTALGDWLYFSADDGVHGRELWMSDGTAEGTIMLPEIRPGDGSSYLWFLTEVGDTLFFRADDGEHGLVELWSLKWVAYTYLPLVFNNYVSAPDLVVERIVATANDVQVVVRNQGNAPATDDFWVDVYVDPDPVPTAVNQIWPTLADQGLVWGVTADLAAGEAITLTVGDGYYVPSYSYVAWPLESGVPVYAQVDSANAGTTYGAVRESHEIAGDPYNNITGPVLVGLGAAEARPAEGNGLSPKSTGDGLPPR
jgi:ELWxxDGT repeat protein